MRHGPIDSVIRSAIPSVIHSVLALVFTAAIAIGASGCQADNPFYQPPGPAGDGGSAGPADLKYTPVVDLPLEGPGDLAFTSPPDLVKPPPPPPADMSMPNGGMGAPCKVACDCQSGLACNMNQCSKPQFGGPLYCCQAMDCPMGQNCQALDGNYSRCGGGGGGGGGDGGGGMGWCMFVPCMTDNGCQGIGCGFCNQKTGHCQ